MEKLKTVIVDDNPKATESLEIILRQYCSQEVTILETFSSPKKAYDKITNKPVDLIFLDIEMPEMNGFKLLEKIRKKQSIEVIFISVHGDRAIQAFKVSAVDYLKKPFAPKDVVQAIRKIEEKKTLLFHLNHLHTLLKNPELHILDQKMTITSTYGFLYVPFRDVVYCEGVGNKTLYHLQNNTTIVECRVIRDVAVLLPPIFFYRVHKSYVVNKEYIQEYKKKDGHHILLRNAKKTRLDIARERVNDFLLWLKNLN